MRKTIIYILIAVTACSLKCENGLSTRKVVIEGNLKGLPDGIIHLKGWTLNKKYIYIDSTITKNGRFYFALNKNKLPYLLTLEHYDKMRTKRLFVFKTNRTYRGGPWLSEYFMPDDTVLIKGTLTDFMPKDFHLPSNIKIAYPDQPIKAGKQTYVMYNVSYDFTQTATDNSINTLSNLIRKYSYSYYLIMEINDHCSGFTDNQIKELLLLFNKDVQQSDVAISLKKSLGFRSKKEINDVSFLNKDFKKTTINMEKSRITMVVLWASWCPPCRREIPALKKIYKQFSDNPNFQLISVSLDSKKENWKRALAIEKMPWQQLLLPPEIDSYGNEIFKFDGLIPTTILFNNSGTEIKRITGDDENSYAIYKKLLSDNLKN